MKDDNIFLLQTFEFIDKIESYTEGGYEEFINSPMIQDAVIRNFEIIGEAAKQIPNTMKAKYPAISWREIAGFRDILIHRYMGIDVDEVWNVVRSDLPILKTEILEILSSFKGINK